MPLTRRGPRSSRMRTPAQRSALGDPRISTTPTIGIGLERDRERRRKYRSPIASFNTPGILSVPVDGRLFRPDSLNQWAM